MKTRTMKSINPATNLVIAEYQEHTPHEYFSILESVHTAFQSWKLTDFVQRSQPMRKMAEILRQRKTSLAALMAAEMGKPIGEGEAEIEKCAWVCEYYATEAEDQLRDRVVQTDAVKSYVSYRPLGPVLAIMPWNFPFWQVFRFAAPNLMAGNTGLLKHASNVTGCALAIESLFQEAGFPADVFRTLLLPGSNLTVIITNETVRAVTLTGSSPAGISAAISSATVLKKTVLELGGSDPYLILEDADLDLAVEKCVFGRLLNSGQSCIAAKRFIVHRAVLEAFEKRFTKVMKGKSFGDPMDPTSDIGPMARVDLRDELHDQVTRSVAKGAKLLCGGVVPEQAGAWYPPTVLTNVSRGMPAFDQELFGPVAAIIAADNDDDAIAIANDSEFGLGAAVFTRDLVKGETIARDYLDAGSVAVNDFVRSDPRLPFGGIKTSGYGRELSSEGIREFMNVKTVVIQ